MNGRFEILAPIARGGTGRVYRAMQQPIGREVAIKVLDPKQIGSDDAKFATRFFLEAATLAQLSHPNTVTVYDYGRTDDDTFFIAMELVEGRTLAALLADVGRLPCDRAVRIASQIARAVREAHQKDVIHRDLKPANVLLSDMGDEKDFVKVFDFGLVKQVGEESVELTATDLFMGSPKYMSPEQIQSQTTDARSDIYSLGVILYQMLGGRVPFDGKSPMDILSGHLYGVVPPLDTPDVPPALESVVHRCLAKRADDRFATMSELLGALRDIFRDRSVELTMSGDLPAFESSGSFELTGDAPPSVPVRLEGGDAPSSGPVVPAVRPPKRRAPLAWAGALVVLLGGAGAFLWVRAQHAPETPAPAPPPSTHEVTTPPEAEAPAVTPEVPAAPPATEPPPVEAPVEPAIEHRVLLELRSRPRGADIWIADRIYGRTPAEIEWRGERARPGRVVSILFRKRGYEPLVVERTLDGSASVEVEAELVRTPR